MIARFSRARRWQVFKDKPSVQKESTVRARQLARSLVRSLAGRLVDLSTAERNTAKCKKRRTIGPLSLSLVSSCRKGFLGREKRRRRAAPLSFSHPLRAGFYPRTRRRRSRWRRIPHPPSWARGKGSGEFEEKGEIERAPRRRAWWGQRKRGVA